MIKKILLTLVVLIVYFTSQSQKKGSFGIKAGVNYSTILISSDKDRYEFDYKKGLYIGTLFNIQYSDSYAFQPEIIYSNQGGKSKSSENEDENIHYISLAATNKFFVMNDKKFHILAGISVDFNLFDNLIENKNGYGKDDEMDGSYEDDSVSAIDLALFTGLGYQFDFGLILEARYKYGFVAVFSDEILMNIIDRSGSKNSLFQIGMAYKFDFKK